MIGRLTFVASAIALVLSIVLLHAQEPDARQIAQERKQAELEAPQIAAVLQLAPGMTVADVGSGNGAMSVVLGRWLGTGRVFAGGAATTNLPGECCDAVFLRNVGVPGAVSKMTMASARVDYKIRG